MTPREATRFIQFAESIGLRACLSSIKDNKLSTLHNRTACKFALTLLLTAFARPSSMEKPRNQHASSDK